jgi:hypothetical protein
MSSLPAASSRSVSTCHHPLPSPWGRLGRLPFLDQEVVEEEGMPLPILLRLVVGQHHPDHPVLAVAAPQGQLLPVLLLPLLVHACAGTPPPPPCGPGGGGGGGGGCPPPPPPR